MNWIKGNGLIGRCTKLVLFLTIMMLLSIENLYCGPSEVAISNGQPYYAQKITDSNGNKEDVYKWFSLYILLDYNNSYTSSDKGYFLSGDWSYNVYAPCKSDVTCDFRVDGINKDTKDAAKFLLLYNNTNTGDNTTNLLTSWKVKDFTDKVWGWRDINGLPTNVNSIRLHNDGSNAGAFLNHIQIELAPHILLDNNTTTGTNNLPVSGSGVVGQLSYIEIPFRSFLTSGDMTVTISNNSTALGLCDPATGYISHETTLTILQGSNLCGIKGGASGSVYDGSNHTPGNASYKNVKVWFIPTGTSAETATITISDGTNYATATITATGSSALTGPLSNGKPYYVNDKWYSLYQGSYIFPVDRGADNSDPISVYSPCKKDLSLGLRMVYQNSKNNNPTNSTGIVTNSGYFALGYNGTMPSSGTNTTGYIVDWAVGNVFTTGGTSPVTSTKTETDWKNYSIDLTIPYNISGTNGTQGNPSNITDWQTPFLQTCLPIYSFEFHNRAAANMQVQNMQVELDNHIRLENSSDTGTVNLTLDETSETTYIGEVQKITIPIRSFLVSNSITVTMVNRVGVDVFRLDQSDPNVTTKTLLSNTSGATLCGISGGPAGNDYSGATKYAGDASLLNFDVYYYPTDDQAQKCTLTITSGTLTATVIVQAKGTKATKNNGKPYYDGTDWCSIYDYSGQIELYEHKGYGVKDFQAYTPSDNVLTFQYHPSCGSDYYIKVLYESYTGTEISSRENDGMTCDAFKPFQDNLNTIDFNIITFHYTDAVAGHYGYLMDIKLKLANHVRIKDGSTYGTDNTSYNFNTTDQTIYCGDTKEYTFNLRSFLTANNLKMRVMRKDGDSYVEDETLRNTFQIVYNGQSASNTDVYITSKGNICGYPSASAMTSASPAIPINTSAMPITIKYMPTTAGTQEAVLVFYDESTPKAYVTLTGTATVNTFIFDNQSGDNSWSNEANWGRKSGVRANALPTADDEVSIQADCTIPNCSTAVAKSLTFNGDNAKLTVNPQGVLNVTDEITNNDATKLWLKSDADNSASVLFTSGTNPKATIECYFRGVPSKSRDAGKTNQTITPQWQYRGFIGTPDATNWKADEVLVYEWNEASNGWNTGTNGDGRISAKAGAAWTGYSMGFTDTTSTTKIKTYTTTLLPTNSTQPLTLSYSGADKGLNLVTNSFSAPVRIGSIDFGDNVEKEIVFFNTTYYDTLKNATNKMSHYTTFPQNTGQITDVDDCIPAGQSFFCFTKGSTNNTITLPAPATQASGAMYAPRVEEDFNVLKIYAESESERDEVYLVESEKCTHNYDNGYDGTKYFTDGMGQIYGKNDFGRTFIAADSSMLGQMIGFKAGSNDMTYTLRFDTERLSGYDELYLYDRVTKRYVNILEGGTYSFTGSTEGEDERFQIIGRMEDSDSFITGSDHALEVVSDRALLRGFDGEDEVIYMTDLAGKMVWSDNAKNGPWFNLPTNIAPGLYIIHCGDATAKYLKR